MLYQGENCHEKSTVIDSYSESAYDYIRDMMREDAFNMGAMDFDCYDSDEEFETYS